ncbi:MAG: Protein FixB [Promethearchaeota archaeon]|nr:MAG: Protein FixB [Candidatus Lokiarchaeota archaeon]
MSQNQGVMVVGEHFKNEIQDVVYELLGKGRKLADTLNVNLSIVFLGSDLDKKLEDLGSYGVDEVIYVKSPVFRDYYSDLYVDTLIDTIQERKPEILLIAATPTGRDFAPRISKRLNVGLTADCTQLEIEEGSRTLLQTCPTYGGNLMATMKAIDSYPQMSTVACGIFEPVRIPNKKAEIIIIKKDIKKEDSVSKILKSIEKEKQTVNLSEAEVVVAGGRGLGSKENFKMIEELAEVLNGEIAGSRVPVELGWMEKERQIGQTGAIVSPKLYIACGISGAIQHLVGMENSDVIVAINKDPNASIFEVAHYGIVGDVNKIIPELIKELKKRNE